MKKIIFILLLISPFLYAQNNIKGVYFIDSLSKLPLTNVLVLDQNGSFTAITDDNGFLNFEKIKLKTDNISAQKLGFKTKLIALNEIKNKNITTISLQSKNASLKEILILSNTNNSFSQTISDLDIKLRPINNTQDVLRIVPGLFIGQHAGGGKAEQIFLRGFDIDHGTDINITVDEMPVNMVSHAHGQGYADLHFIIPELIENINFNKGSYFAEKGNFTTAGNVAFKTKDYLENNFIKTEVGQFNT